MARFFNAVYPAVVMGILLLPIALGALFMPVYAVYGFYSGEYLGAAIAAVITLAFWPFAVIVLIAKRSHG